MPSAISSGVSHVTSLASIEGPNVHRPSDGRAIADPLVPGAPVRPHRPRRRSLGRTQLELCGRPAGNGRPYRDVRKAETLLRELLYVDVNRCRSLLSQLDYGIVETIVESRGRGASANLGATLLGLTGDLSTSSTRSTEESRSLQDLLFAVFEEVVESQGVLRTLDESGLVDPVEWQESKVHGRLVEGEIVKVFMPVAIVDPHFVEKRFERFIGLFEGINEMQDDPVQVAVKAAEAAMRAEMEATLEASETQGIGRDRLRKERVRLEGKLNSQLKQVEQFARSELAANASEDVDPEVMEKIANVLSKFLASDAMSVRFLACGEERPDLGFIGSLLGRDEYIQRERDALFARYGSTLNGWTSILQIAAIPSKANRDQARERSFDNLDFAPDGNIDRAVVERAAMGLLEAMDAIGVSEGPMWPTISVVPLGIYRTVPRSGDLGDEEPASST